MANQPPSRPWFRLSSLRSVAAPPAPAQNPRPSLVQPTNKINTSPPPAERGSVPSSPAQKPPVQSYSSSLPNSPLQNGSSLSTSSSVSSSSPTKKPSPPPSSVSSPAMSRTSPSTKQVVQNVIQSPKAKPTTPQSASSSTKQMSQTVMQSPKAKTTTPPPSPLTLPPAQLKVNSEVKPKIPEEAESKSVILQKQFEKPKHWGNGDSEETQKNHNEKQNGNHRKSWGLEDSPMKVITIAGENRGAYMELIQSPKKHESGDKSNYLYRSGGVSKIKSENGESGSSSSDEGNVKKKENKNNRRTKSSHPMSAFMNSNVQCVNNSILYNASCNHHDPGLRLSLTKKPFEREGFHLVNGRHD